MNKGINVKNRLKIDRLLGTAEIKEVFGLSRGFIHSAVSRKKLNRVRVAGTKKVLFWETDVLALFETEKTKPTTIKSNTKNKNHSLWKRFLRYFKK